jgi:hypothetical protein
MSPTRTPVIQRYRSMLDVLAGTVASLDEMRALTDSDLLELNNLQASIGRSVGSGAALIAGELAHRSRPELGADGLARRTGHRTVENLLRFTTGATKQQVTTVVAAGTLLTEMADEGKVDGSTGEVKEPTKPWLRDAADAVAAGVLSTSALASISRGLGQPDSAVTAEQLACAVAQLVAAALAGVDADRLWRDARDLRNELDLGGVRKREAELIELRGLTHVALPNGMGRAIWDMDPVTYARFIDYYDRATSPKRGGVRFVDPAKAEQARGIADDPRGHRQIASDTFLHLLENGAGVDDSELLGAGSSIIRITVAASALESGVGFARIDGQPAPISIETVRTLAERAKTIVMPFDRDGTYIEKTDPRLENVRLFSRGQHEILSAKFGGCMDPHCDRPPAWTEAHHILFVKRDGGKTTIRNGILLCKYHHLLYHNQGYEILVDQFGRYWKVPPPSVDPAQVPTLMPLKTGNLNDLWAAELREAS